MIFSFFIYYLLILPRFPKTTLKTFLSRLSFG
ncbi:hypothetical protein EFD32_1922 [Enterococcus faecalis D32]|nr:hypothetical protein EFD32_1922 [Enterococcus faecalis D32]